MQPQPYPTPKVFFSPISIIRRRITALVAVVVVLALPVVIYAQNSSKPPAPTLTPDSEGMSVVIEWDSLSSGSGVTWEVLVWTEQSGWTRLDDGNLTVTHLEHTGIEVGIEYWYTYRSVQNDTKGEWSHYGNIVLSDNTSPSFSAPTVTAKLSGQDINVQWTEVPGAVNYRLACWCGLGKWEIVDAYDSLETNYTAFPSITYHLSVQAVNAAGASTAWSEYATVTTPAVIPTNTPIPEPTATPTPTPVPTSAYGKWLPGITIAPENHCSDISQTGWYGFNRRSDAAQILREQIIASMDGRLYDPYLGLYFGRLDMMEINHVVEIREAHISGMCDSSRESARRPFVYDPENAVLASVRLTGHSHAYDLAEWLPDLNKCWYVNQVVHVKRKYGLTMDTDEADTAIDVLSGCASTDMIFSDSPTPTPTIVTQDPLQMYDDNGDGHISCEEAERHGIAPVHRVHPAYPYMDDPDGNGIACEQ